MKSEFGSIGSVKLNLMLAVGLVLLLGTPAQSQFVEFVGVKGGFSVTEASDKGILVTGNGDVPPYAQYSVLLAKFDAEGKPIWRTALKSGTGFSVIEVSDGGIVVTGLAGFGAGSGDVLLAKFSASGETLWTKSLGGTEEDEGKCVIKGFGSRIVVTGYTESFGAGSKDLLLTTFNASGDTLWTRTLGGVGNDEGWSVTQPEQVTQMFVTGYTESFGAGGRDLLLASFNYLGGYYWTKTLGGAGNDEGRCVIWVSGGLFVTGYTESFGTGERDLLLAKFDENGDTLWTRTIGGADGWSVIQTSDGGLVVAGVGGDGVLLAKFDGSGNLLWTRTFGLAPYGTVGYSVIQTWDDDFVVRGMSWDPDIPYSNVALLAKFDAWGNICLGGPVSLTVESVSPEVGDPDPTVNWISPTFTSQSPPCTSLTPLASLWCEAPPKIDTISDVGNDQGRQVRVKWHRCYFDIVGSPVTITEYSLWRRIGEDKKMDRTEEGWPFEVGELKVGRIYPPGDWDFIKTIPARGESVYNTVCPTLGDSTQADSMYWSVFFVSAMTSNPLVYFDSYPDSGYSLDNIPPLPIEDLEVDTGSWFTLQWTVPGEYPEEHPISSYNIRYDTIPVVDADTQTWWDSATVCTTGEAFFNFIVGKKDRLEVAEDCGCHPHVYFAIKGLDDRPNASEISNFYHFICGDCNSSGIVELGDVVYLISYLYRGGPPPKPLAKGDINCNGEVNLGDLVYLITYLYKSGPSPCSSP